MRKAFFLYQLAVGSWLFAAGSHAKRYEISFAEKKSGPSGSAPIWGKGGSEATKGGAFSSPKGRLYGFLHIKRHQMAMLLICLKCVTCRLAFRKPNNQPTAEEIHPLWCLRHHLSPGGGTALRARFLMRQYHLYRQP